MSFKNVSHVLASAVAQNGTFAVAYPSGFRSGSFAGAHGHKLWSAGHQKMYEAPEGFTVSFGASDMTVTYKGSTALPAGSRVNLQLDMLGDNARDPMKARVNDKIGRAVLATLDLGAPITADADGVAASQSVSASANFVINGALASAGKVVFDVPRNVVAAWTGTAVLTITGKDVDGNTVIEASASGTSHTGSKAFKEVTSVSTSANITSATVGSGVKIGLPAYMPDGAYVLAELKNGAALPRRPGKALVMDRMLEAAVDAGTSLEITSPYAGRISKLSLVAGGTITTGGAVTVEVNTVAVDGLSVTVADGAAAGEYDSGTPTAGHATAVVAVGDRIEIIPAAGFNASADIFVILEIDLTGAQQMDGTLVAGVTSAATATTGDTRGTYTPSKTPDGTDQYVLLAALPDPSNRGVPQYDG